MSGRAESGGSPGLLPGPARVLGMAVAAVALAACWLVSVGKVVERVDGSQFADTTGGAAMYAVTVATRAMFTPPLEYVTLALALSLGALLVLAPVVMGLDAMLDLGLLADEHDR